MVSRGSLHPLPRNPRFRSQQFFRVRGAGPPPVARPDENVIPEQRLVEEHVLERPSSGELPHFVRPRVAGLRAAQHLVGRAVLDEHPAPIGPPSRDLRGPALAVAAGTSAALLFRSVLWVPST